MPVLIRVESKSSFTWGGESCIFGGRGGGIGETKMGSRDAGWMFPYSRSSRTPFRTNIDDMTWMDASRQGKQKWDCKNAKKKWPGLACSHNHPARDLGAVKKGHELKILPKCYFYLRRRKGKALRGWMRNKGEADLRRDQLKIVPHPSHILGHHHLVFHLNKHTWNSWKEIQARRKTSGAGSWGGSSLLDGCRPWANEQMSILSPDGFSALVQN